jgi:hypothetical protein
MAFPPTADTFWRMAKRSSAVRITTPWFPWAKHLREFLLAVGGFLAGEDKKTKRHVSRN